MSDLLFHGTWWVVKEGGGIYSWGVKGGFEWRKSLGRESEFIIVILLS